MLWCFSTRAATPLPTVSTREQSPSPHCLSHRSPAGRTECLDPGRVPLSTVLCTSTYLSPPSQSPDEHLLELYGGNFVSSHEVSPRFLRILASPPPERAHLPPLTGSLPNGVPPPNGVSFKRYSSWSPLPIGNLEKKKPWGRIWGRSPVALPFSDFLGRLQPSRTTIQRTLNTLGVEESSSPRRVLHFPLSTIVVFVVFVVFVVYPPRIAGG